MKNNVKMYKVLHVTGDKQVSAVASDSNRVIYEANKLIIPNTGKNPALFVFSDLEHALQFANNACYKGYGFSIYKVLANNVRDSFRAIDGCFRANNFPDGTKFCSSLTLEYKVMSVTYGGCMAKHNIFEFYEK